METSTDARIAVLGASPHAERVSGTAVERLRDAGYAVTPIHPTATEVAGLAVVKELADVPTPVHTLTVYVNPTRSSEMMPDIFKLSPQRIVMNPGAENDRLAMHAEARGIVVVRECTLVMLATDRF